MIVEPIGAVILLIGILILVRGPFFGMYLFIASTLLGSCAALILSALGGATIQPAHLLLGFMGLAILSREGSWAMLSDSMTFPREGFWLIATAVFGACGAFLFPRIFAGATYVDAIGAADFGGGSPLQVPLGPTSGNLTQCVYFIGDVGFFLVCYAFARSRAGFDVMVQSFLIYSALNVVFALLDLATFWTGTGFLLDFIRNSNYQLHNDTVINGLKRIVGSFTEASAFASATIAVFAYTFRLWLGGIRPWLTFSLAMINLALVVLSTSTTGYVALPVLLVYFYGESLVRAFRESVPRTVFAFLGFTPLLAVALCAIIMLIPDTASAVADFVNTMVLSKGSSDSAIDRGSWNTAAYNAFIATYGLGAGVGSLRASSFLFALIGNLGVIGTATYGMFLYLTLYRRAPRPIGNDVYEIRASARTACIALLVSSSISGTMIDLGLPFFALAALACAANELVPGRQMTRSVRTGMPVGL